jgi:hypothetical protein
MAVWQTEHAAWSRSLVGKQYAYLWVDAIYFNIRLEDAENAKQCILVLMGATPEGRKELIAVQDGYRESEQSWLTLLLDKAARPDDRSEAGGRRWRAGLLRGLAEGVFDDGRAALLGSQGGECAGQDVEARAGRRQGEAASDMDGADARGRPRGFPFEYWPWRGIAA